MHGLAHIRRRPSCAYREAAAHDGGQPARRKAADR